MISNILKIQNNSNVILNQGGVSLNEGDKLNVFQKGEILQDPYTGESLGPSESLVATIEIKKVNPKMSYAKILKGNINNISIGDICRRSKNNNFKNRDFHSKGSNIEFMKDGGILLPFDNNNKKKKEDKL